MSGTYVLFYLQGKEKKKQVTTKILIIITKKFRIFQ